MTTPFRSLRPTRLLTASLALLSLLGACSPKVPATQTTAQTATQDRLQQKIYPVLVTFQESRYAKELQKSSFLTQASAQRTARVNQAVQTCQDVPCLANAVQWSPQEIQEVGNELVRLYGASPTFKGVVAPLRKSGSYDLYESSPDTAFLRSAWQHAAEAMNHATNVYLKGKAPRYPKIDAISFKVEDPAFKQRVQQMLGQAATAHKQGLFFQLPLTAATEALVLNGRDEGIRYEPLQAGMNAAPFAQAKNTKWANFKYSLILIPGFGPEEEGIILHEKAKNRCKMGLERYQKGLAPFIVVSGGNVHPNKTPYNEAVEMKKYMMDSLRVPDHVIIIEPHARHTTTNLRNTNRLLYTLQMPLDKPMLIVTDEAQSSYIMRFEKKAIQELGYAPFQQLKKLSEVETEYVSVPTSRHLDPLDHLDP